ncbi:MAG TPA: hypothetical protein VFK13_09815 [Gemmatimonadaceae bacterium]|nr:hypothetical protein [Gemmatimonadaceae bacterium]
MRYLSPLLVIALAACASGGSAHSTPSAPEQPAKIQANGAGGTGTDIDTRVAPDNSVLDADIPATMDKTWAALMEAYKQMGLRVDQLDQQAHTIATQNFRVRGKLNGHPMIRYVSCGNDIYGPVANSHTIVLTVSAAAVPDGDDKTRVSVRMEAAAVPTEGTSTGLTHCDNTGRLEREIVQRVQGQIIKEGIGS